MHNKNKPFSLENCFFKNLPTSKFASFKIFFLQYFNQLSMNFCQLRIVMQFNRLLQLRRHLVGHSLWCFIFTIVLNFPFHAPCIIIILITFLLNIFFYIFKYYIQSTVSHSNCITKDLWPNINSFLFLIKKNGFKCKYANLSIF